VNETWVDVLKEAGKRAERRTNRGMWWILPLALIAGTAAFGYLVTHPTEYNPGDGTHDHWSD
jgi:hypothetical protein